LPSLADITESVHLGDGDGNGEGSHSERAARLFGLNSKLEKGRVFM